MYMLTPVLRFITCVPAGEVLETVQSVLHTCRATQCSTPLGPIGRLDLNWELFSLDVWGCDPAVLTSLCSLRIYRLPQTGTAASPLHSAYLSHSAQASPSRNIQLYLVEFVRGQGVYIHVLYVCGYS